MLSGELATHLAGRYVSFKIFPLTFKEVCELKNLKDKREVSKITLYNYLEYMTKAMMISKADRYDVRGKRIIISK